MHPGADIVGRSVAIYGALLFLSLFALSSGGISVLPICIAVLGVYVRRGYVAPAGWALVATLAVLAVCALLLVLAVFWPDRITVSSPNVAWPLVVIFAIWSVGNVMLLARLLLQMTD